MFSPAVNCGPFCLLEMPIPWVGVGEFRAAGGGKELADGILVPGSRQERDKDARDGGWVSIKITERGLDPAQRDWARRVAAIPDFVVGEGTAMEDDGEVSPKQSRADRCVAGRGKERPGLAVSSSASSPAVRLDFWRGPGRRWGMGGEAERSAEENWRMHRRKSAAGPPCC